MSTRPLHLPPWKVPDGDLPVPGYGLDLAPVAPFEATQWAGRPLRAADQGGHPVVWWPDGYKRWATHATRPYYLGANLKTGAGAVIRAPRVLALAGHDTANLIDIALEEGLTDPDLQALADQGNLMVLVDTAQLLPNSSYAEIGGLPNQQEVLVPISTVFPGLTASVGTADPTTYIGGDFFTIFYANTLYASNDIASDFFTFAAYYDQVGQAVAAAAPAFSTYGRVNYYGPDLARDPTSLGNYNRLITALGDYGTSTRVGSDAEALALARQAVKTFFNLT